MTRWIRVALAYTTETRTTLFISTESTCDYTARRGTIPLQLSINQLLRIGGVPFQLGGLVRYYVDTRPEADVGIPTPRYPLCSRSCWLSVSMIDRRTVWRPKGQPSSPRLVTLQRWNTMFRRAVNLIKHSVKDAGYDE